MRTLFTSAVIGLLVSGTLALSASPTFAQTGATLYVGDYNQSSIYRYDTNGNLIGGGPFIGSAYNVKEGIEGTANSVIAVTGGGSSLSRFRSDGTFVGTINGKNLAGTATQTYSSIGNVQITPDAQFLYVPDSGAGILYKVSVATGNVVAQTGMTGVHDVAIDASGNVYAATYNSTATGGSGIVEYKNTTGGAYSNLSAATTFVAPGFSANSYNLDRPSGISIDASGNVYVVNENENLSSGGGQANGAVFEFSSAGALVNETSSPLIEGAFGTAFAPDGNLYIATLGDFVAAGSSNTGSKPGYVNGVYEFNTTTHTFSDFVAGGTSTAGHTTSPNSTSQLQGPKYVQFSSDFANANDPGLPVAAPEPGSVALLALSGLPVVGMVARRRRKTT